MSSRICGNLRGVAAWLAVIARSVRSAALRCASARPSTDAWTARTAGRGAAAVRGASGRSRGGAVSRRAAAGGVGKSRARAGGSAAGTRPDRAGRRPPHGRETALRPRADAVRKRRRGRRRRPATRRRSRRRVRRGCCSATPRRASAACSPPSIRSGRGLKRPAGDEARGDAGGGDTAQRDAARRDVEASRACFRDPDVGDAARSRQGPRPRLRPSRRRAPRRRAVTNARFGMPGAAICCAPANTPRRGAC